MSDSFTKGLYLLSAGLFAFACVLNGNIGGHTGVAIMDGLASAAMVFCAFGGGSGGRS